MYARWDRKNDRNRARCCAKVEALVGGVYDHGLTNQSSAAHRLGCYESSLRRKLTADSSAECHHLENVTIWTVTTSQDAPPDPGFSYSGPALLASSLGA